MFCMILYLKTDISIHPIKLYQKGTKLYKMTVSKRFLSHLLTILNFHIGD